MVKKIIKSKKESGMSSIVATVMLIVIAVIGVSVIATFVIPMVRDSPQKGGDCFNSRDLLFISSGIGDVNTCWNSTNKEMIVVVKRSPDDINLNGFAISLAESGSSKRFDVIDGVDNPEVTTVQYHSGPGNHYQSAGTEPEKILERGSEYTYYFNTTMMGGAIVRVEIAPVLKSGDTCPATESFEVEPC